MIVAKIALTIFIACQIKTIQSVDSNRKCYACGTVLTKETSPQAAVLSCPEPFDNNAPKQQSYCVGRCRKTIYKRGDQTITARSCSPVCYPEDTPDVKTFCCDSDLCNGVPKLHGTVIIFAVSFVFSAISFLL